ncbi:MAG: FHA domain-containing protein [Solirubrobacterales bacterium]|nr:FHA domain-containing protein [Solirubrobacterales bacterium]
MSKRTRTGGSPIFESLDSALLGESLEAGFSPGSGTFYCLECGSQLALGETDSLPECPGCGGARFRRDSIFAARQEHGAATAKPPVHERSAPPEWLAEARRTLGRPGDHLVLREDDGALAGLTIEPGWTRIGRSVAADLRLDDPSVSRRHALIVAEPGADLMVLDDRSLDGVFVNGARIEWAPLRDGDELTIGRYRLYAVRTIH